MPSTERLELDPNYVEAMANKAYCYINEVVTKRQNGGYKYAGSNLDRVKGQKAVDQYNKELKENSWIFRKALPLMEKSANWHLNVAVFGHPPWNKSTLT